MYAQFNFTTLHPLRLFPSRKSTLLFSSMLLTLMLNFFASSAKAQCYCTPVFTVGSAAGRPTLTSAISAFGAGFATPGAVCIRVEGQFDVDAGQTWALTGTRLSFANSSSSLFVLNGCTVTAQSASFRPCDAVTTTWLGVYVQTGATLTANQCLFVLADNAAVSAAPNSTFRLTNSQVLRCNKGLKIIGNQTPANHTVSGNSFRNNSFGIYMVGARNIGIGNNTYELQDDPGPMTGIHMESICENVNITGGTFIRQERGVSSVKTINLEVTGSIFRNNTTAVFSTQGSKTLYVRNCSFSTTIERGIFVKYHDTDAAAVNGDVLLEGNSFILQSQENNILLANIGGTGRGTVRNNTMELPKDIASGSAPQYGIEVVQAYAREGIFIENNQLNLITALTAPGGILVDGCDYYCLVRNNTVQNTSSTVSMPSLIHARNCTKSLEVIGNTVEGGAAISTMGISIEDCPDEILLCCNRLNNTRNGLYIKGALNGSLIYNTVFGNHPFAALYYDQITSTGAPQVNHGNDWSGASGTWDAYFDGSGAVASVVNYVVSTANLPNLLTKINVTGGMPSDWFAVNHETEPSCSNTTTSYCGQDPGDKDGEGGGQDGGDGRSQQSTWSEVAIYPNPADQSLFVSWPAAQQGNTAITLRDGLGRTVLQQQALEGANNLNLSTANLPAGMYLLEMRQNGQPTSLSKIMIQH